MSCSCLQPHHGAAQRSRDLFMSFLWLCTVKEREFVVCPLLCHDGGGRKKFHSSHRRGYLPFPERLLVGKRRFLFSCMSQRKDEVSGDGLPSSPISGIISEGRNQSIRVSGLFSHITHVPWLLGGGEKSEKLTQGEPQL